jgi:hypothetical protein
LGTSSLGAAQIVVAPGRAAPALGQVALLVLAPMLLGAGIAVRRRRLKRASR